MGPKKESKSKTPVKTTTKSQSAPKKKKEVAPIKEAVSQSPKKITKSAS